MGVHNWTRIEAGLFHDFHVAWIAELRSALNEGLLPGGYYALAEQQAGERTPDVLTLHSAPLLPDAAESGNGNFPSTGGTAVAEIPPRVRLRRTVHPSAARLRRSIAIRHVSGHRLVALIEIVSPANKDRPSSMDDFCNKTVEALDAGVSVLIIDLFPPGRHDPNGIHGGILEGLSAQPVSPQECPSTQEPITLVTYVGPPPVNVYLEQASVGGPLPDMPLFLDSEHYVNVPLEPSYESAYRGFPAYWRDVLEGRRSHDPS
jgi:hypothetical protein